MTSNDNQASPATQPSVWQEVTDFWRQMPDKGLFLALLAAWTVVYHVWGNSTFGVFGRPTPSLFEWMYLVFTTSDDDFHGLLVLPGVLVLLFVNRKELLSIPKGVWWPALGLVILGALLHLLGYRVQQPRISIMGFFTGVYGLTGLVWGGQWLRCTFFPMFLFAFCIPLGAMGDSLTHPLRMLVSKISVFISDHLLGIPVMRDGVQIYSPTGGFRYEVAAACSGIRSLISLLALTTIYGFLSFKSPWRRLAMLAASIPLAIISNTVRLTVIIIVAEAMGQQAGMYVETKFGFVTFAVAMVCVFALGWWMREDRTPPPAAQPEVKPA